MKQFTLVPVAIYATLAVLQIFVFYLWVSSDAGREKIGVQHVEEVVDLLTTKLDATLSLVRSMAYAKVVLLFRLVVVYDPRV